MLHTPDTDAGAIELSPLTVARLTDAEQWRTAMRPKPGETPFQGFTRQEFERVANLLANYPDCPERAVALTRLAQSCEAATAAAGKVS